MLKRAFIILLFSSGIIIWLVYAGVPLFYFRQGIVGMLAVILLLLISFAIPPFKRVLQKGRWLLFVLAQLLVQLLLVTTGGLASPYLVLVHLTFFGISFFFSFGVAMLFLTFMFILLSAHIIIDLVALQELLSSPEAIFLYGTSFITIVPIAYVLTRQYHAKDTVSKTLTDQIKIEESILTDLNELVLVADASGKIVSLNDAVEKTLHKSRSEILQSPLFTALLIKDMNGKLLNDPLLLQKNEPQILENVSLLTSFGMTKVKMQIKPISDLKGGAGQVSIIITPLTEGKNGTSSNIVLIQEAVTKHDAMFEDLKNRLEVRGQHDLKDKAVMIAKAEEDIRIVRELQGSLKEQKVPIDLATLCRETVMREGDYAQTFGVLLDFSFINFGREDIEPLLSGTTMIISPDQLTGPFFTASIDVKYMGIILQKLLDIAILTVPKLQEKTVRLTIERAGATDLLVKVLLPNSMLTTDDLPNLFKEYYGDLSNKTDLHFGSGLEGFIAKEISTQLRYPLQVNLTKDSERIVFMLWVGKGEQSLATLATKQQQQAVPQKNSIQHSEPQRIPLQANH